MAQPSLAISSTSKFSVWSLPKGNTRASNVNTSSINHSEASSVLNTYNDGVFAEKGSTYGSDGDMDLNQALTMLGGSFAMSMFAINDDDEEEEITKVTDSSVPSAVSLLEKCMTDSDVNEKLADAQYWEDLAEATAALYPYDPLTVGETLGNRTTENNNVQSTSTTPLSYTGNKPRSTLGIATEGKKYLSELEDKGYCVVPPNSENHQKRRSVSGLSSTGGFGSLGVTSGTGSSGFGGFASSTGLGGSGGTLGLGDFTPGVLSSGTFGGDGLAFINSDETESSMKSSLNTAASLFNTIQATSNEYDLMARAVRVVEDNGWPPVFALMYDAPWAAVQRAWSIASKVLGDDCELEPSLFIWSLTRNIDTRDLPPLKEEDVKATTDEEEKRCSRIGQNFGLPHRDFSYEESHFPDGSPRILNIWMPFTDVDVDNGCLWVVPREFDPFYDQPESYEHSRPATPSSFEKGCSKLRFPIGAARPITAQKGSAVMWHNVIHWGGNCGKNAQIPRISLAATFKAKNSEATHLTSNGLLSDVFEGMKATQSTSVMRGGGGSWKHENTQESQMSTKNRMKLIASALLMYSDWFDLEGKALPDDFYRLAGFPKPTNVATSKDRMPMEEEEFSSMPPSTTPLTSVYDDSENNQSTTLKPLSGFEDSLITEEEFAEYTPSTQVIDV